MYTFRECFFVEVDAHLLTTTENLQLNEHILLTVRTRLDLMLCNCILLNLTSA